VSPAAQRNRRSWRTWLIGRRLPTSDAAHEAIGKRIGLAVFASDALSSTAYATQEMLTILAAAGIAGFAYGFPLGLTIAALLAVVTLSYWQIIHAYPGGGGAYTVARDNLGELPAQIAAAALLADYVLGVAVSVSAGVAQMASAFPALLEHRVAVAITLVIVIMVVNLRGVKESGTIVAFPSYFFIVVMFTMVVTGLGRAAAGALGVVTDLPPMTHAGEFQALTLFLLLHAFSSGTTALTGVEAISNGITAFREPRSRNAGLTLAWMGGILATLFLGITWLAHRAGAVPSEAETVVSQLARTIFEGRGLVYHAVIAGTTVILILAANTAYNGFPRLSALQASDGFLPRQLTYRGSRLVYSRGIIALAVMACLLIWIFEARVTRLIPLYAIGVFLCFTLAQLGMTRRWWKVGRLAPGVEAVERGSVLRHDRRWRWKLLSNGLGAVATAVVTIVFAVTKFREGAWVVLIVIPLLVTLFMAIHRHYLELGRNLSLDEYGAPPRVLRHRVILPLSGVHRGTVAALRYARSLSHDITAVHVSVDADATRRLEEKWGMWGNGVRLVTLESPYRLLMEPLLEYIERIADLRQSNETLTIVVPQFVARKWWHNLLHAQTAVLLRMALLYRPGIVITNVPYQQMSEDDEEQPGSAGGPPPTEASARRPA
jgi:amino acid transporter